jgi:hypothetical protein
MLLYAVERGQYKQVNDGGFENGNIIGILDSRKSWTWR